MDVCDTAGILMVAGGAFWIHESRDAHVAPVAVPEMREYVTGKGQRTEILLPDGTRVLLSVESRLRVPVTYGVQTRDVTLDGEAFFEVTHNKKVPFRVHAAGALAEDLGTEFTVRAYRGESPTVVVASGMVALRGDRATLSQRVTLTPGKLGRWDAATNITTVEDVDAHSHMTWMHGRIDFKNASLAHIARELERWYDIHIEIPDPTLAASELTVTFKNQPLDEVLSVIARTLDARYRREGARVTFSVNTTGPLSLHSNITNLSSTSRSKR
jgi:transmembrane sensor